MKCTTTLCLLISTLFAHAQGVDPRLVHAMDVNEHHHHYSMRNATNEATLVLSGLFIFYKSFVSSQDGGSCTFTPSCSEYALDAIEKKGVVVGMLAAFDRLSRCNGLSPHEYPYDFNKKLFIDPVD